MNSVDFYHSRLLLLRLAIVFLLFTACRGFFVAFNAPILEIGSAGEFFSILVHGLRYDLSAILYLNAVFMLLHLLPGGFRSGKRYQQLLFWLFILVNVPALFYNLVDIAYFPFSRKRTTIEITTYAGDFLALLPQYLLDYWYIALLLAAMTATMVVAYRHFTLPVPPFVENRFGIQVIQLIVLSGLAFVGMRGGLQLRPLNPINAFERVEPRLVPAVLNTPFQIIYALQHPAIEDRTYLNRSDLLEEYDLVHTHSNSRSDSILLSADFKTRDNVVIIIMESFSPEYMGLYGASTTSTPFLDSLADGALYYENAFANGMRSVESIPSICASLPSLNREDFMQSIYQTNELDGLGHLLKRVGYHSSFFHGGNEGTFNIEAMAGQCGYENYFDRTDYNNDDDFDGNWGIYDRPFFQFAAQKLSSFPQPFHSVLLSLSSHHPYRIPEAFEKKVEHEPRPLLRSIRYSDDALRDFFKTASKTDWFANTLFIITADHNGPQLDPSVYNGVDLFRIPLILFRPNSNLKGRRSEIAQQIDLLPTIADFLDLRHPYCAFGQSLMRKMDHRYVYNFFNQFHQIMDDTYLMQFSNHWPYALFNYQTDPECKANIIVSNPKVKFRMERRIRAVLQTYSESIAENRLSYARRSGTAAEPGWEVIAMGHGGMGIAHLYPLNSLASVMQCIEKGADGVEVDVQLTKDAIPVVFHDSKLQERTNLSGAVADKTWSELTNCHYTAIPLLDFPVASLEQVFTRLKGLTATYISLDCKLYPGQRDEATHQENFAAALTGLIKNYQMENRVFIESNSIEFLKRIRSRQPSLQLFIYPENFEDGYEIATANGFDGITISNRNIQAAQIQKAHDANLKVAVWNTQSGSDNADALRKGADIIQTDRVADLVRRKK